jgi:hypothetical protein
VEYRRSGHARRGLNPQPLAAAGGDVNQQLTDQQFHIQPLDLADAGGGQ